MLHDDVDYELAERHLPDVRARRVVSAEPYLKPRLAQPLHGVLANLPKPDFFDRTQNTDSRTAATA